MATKVIIEKGSDSTYSVYLDVEGIGANGVGSTLELGLRRLKIGDRTK